MAECDAARADVNYYQLMAVPGYPECYPDMVSLNEDIGERAFGLEDTPKYMIASGVPTGKEVTATLAATIASPTSRARWCGRF